MRASRWRVCGVPGAGSVYRRLARCPGAERADLPVGRDEHRLADALDHRG